MAEASALHKVQKARFDRKVDLREAIAMMGTIVGIMGLWLPASQYLESRPRLLLRVEAAVLRSDLTPASVLERLKLIQDNFSAVTLRWIEPGLLHSALALDATDSGYNKALERLAESVAQAVHYFNSDTPSWQIEEISYANSVVTWPDGYSVNLIGDPYSASRFRRLLGELELENAEAIRRAAAEFYPDRQYENAALRRRAGKELRELGDEIYQTVEGKGRRLVISVSVDNASRLPNSIRQYGRVTLRDVNRHSGVGDLRMTRQEDDGRLDGYSGGTLTFRSEVLSASQAGAIEPKSRFILGLEDVNDNVWKAEGATQKSSREGTSGRFIATLASRRP